MTQTAWAHLPNAKHIDWAIDSVKEHREKWKATRTAAYGAAIVAEWSAARDTARGSAWDAARGSAWDAAFDAAFDAVAWSVAWNATFDVTAALIAWDDCAYMIESEVDEMKILAKLGDPRAVLLLPACIVFNQTKELA